MANLLLGVISSLLAAVLLAIGSRVLVQTGVAYRLHDGLALMMFSGGHVFRNRVRRDPEKAVTFFVNWLKRDQTWFGRFRGQFGKRTSAKEERLFQTSSQKLSTKPRLYLTGWPCFVLHSMARAEGNLARAARGVGSLFEDDAVWVYQSAMARTLPEEQPRIISYRHTIRAVQILARLNHSGAVVRNVVGRMLDTREKWQNDDGGWAQCNAEYTNSDLWASAYAAALLSGVVDGRVTADDALTRKAVEALKRTIDFLESQWASNRWSYGKATPEHNGVQILHETIGALKMHRPLFAADVTSWIQTWLTPTGAVSEFYPFLPR